ncbi:MAG TPA: aspartate kinase [Spirochaetia bacterium]|nr:MAG: aspartate kinase [Spirochaetes bacterium GWB1_36_13]HCL55758.1 aspartate kinase [Spirochaetia bacterium]
MSIIVQKYGGTSVGSPDRIKNVAKRVIAYKEKGHEMVVTVSAMSGETDRLLGLAKQMSDEPDERELDMMVSTGEQVSIALLAMALKSMGHEAISMNSSQAGIYTDSSHTKAKIEKIHSEKIEKELKKGKIVIVAGFQGIDENGNITTLGRGGSDTTAVAVAAAIKADKCEIYTDVDGIYTADPRFVKNAQKLKYITYDEMLELAALGAKVMHSRSIEFAKKYNVALEVRSSFSDAEGTIILKEYEGMEKVVVAGITCKKDEAKVSIVGLPDKPGIAALVFGKMAEANINVNMITQSSLSQKSGTNNISFTFPLGDFKKAQSVIETIKKELSPEEIVFDDHIAIVSVVGVGMKTNVGVASGLFAVLGKNAINIQMIGTSEIKISVVIDKNRADDSVALLHEHFKLDKLSQ